MCVCVFRIFLECIWNYFWNFLEFIWNSRCFDNSRYLFCNCDLGEFFEPFNTCLQEEGLAVAINISEGADPSSLMAFSSLVKYHLFMEAVLAVCNFPINPTGPSLS